MATVVALAALLTIMTCGFATGYKPVVIVHGIFDSSSEMQDLEGFIVKVVKFLSNQVVICCLCSKLEKTSRFHCPISSLQTFMTKSCRGKVPCGLAASLNAPEGECCGNF